MGTLPFALVVTQKPLCHGEINYEEGPRTKSQSLKNYPLSLCSCRRDSSMFFRH